ncbi:hypothetical protein [Mycolicibacterium bacteremicum]|uniref:Uncharacterized protein n=1 Tax=Mycolicibacterium bacteremicum TaxID=564198 RepID=A0A1W9Z2X5_MYCBA|nr:hypothetical protein [Mycolicibacterium bacteremicum]MCV7431880.1 hypothetical protein [Mycolicibacterium bacteremicum]ORA06665.1 hypothetical protein BST17_03200 [Mycolicibacterium bacteremicum]
MTAAGQQRTLAVLAVVAGACGIASTIPFHAASQAVLLLALTVAGAGSAVMCWTDLPAAAAVAGTIGVSVAAVVATSTAAAWLHMWEPTMSCLLLSSAVAVTGAVRIQILRRERAPSW